MSETTEEGCLSGRDKAMLRREKIVGAARRLFIANGFHATGVAQIAKESGIAVGQIYRDFASKEAIVAQIVQRDCMEFLDHQALQRGLKTAHHESIWQWIDSFLDAEPDESDPLFAEIVAEAARNPRIAAIFEELSKDVRGSMLSALEVLAPGDAFGSRRSAMADLILSLSLGFNQHRFLSTAHETREAAALALRLVRTELDAMRAEAAAA